MTTPTPQQIAKLPAWARDYLQALQRERDKAKSDYDAFLDEQKPSPFYEEYLGEDLQKRRYIQAQTLVCEWRGVRLRIDANEYGNMGDGIRLQWEDVKRSGRELAFVPGSFQQARIITKEDMR